ncbi:energy transducer TonB [Ekhidna sp.]
MKKNFVIICTALGTLGLMAIGFINQPQNEPVSETDMLVTKEKKAVEKDEPSTTSSNFAYDIGSQFLATISKEDLEKATSINDIIPKEADWSAYPIQKVQVRLVKYDLEVSKGSNDLILNEAQIALLKTAKYSDNLQLTADYAGTLETEDLNYFVTVVPEKEATYADGKDALLSYLKKNSAVIETYVKGDRPGAGKISFTIDTKGAIANVTLSRSSGNLYIDQHMVGLISKATGKWIPAENAKGEKIEQVMMFSYGSLGC